MKIIGRPTVTPTNPEKFSGVTDEQIAAAVEDYIAENPVNKPTDEQIASAVEDYLEEHPIEVPDSGGNVDLTGYATEEWVHDGYQPKGEYLTAVPDGYAKTEDIPTKPEDIGAQPVGDYLTEVPSGYATEEYVKNKIAEAELGGEEVDLSGYAQKSELPTKVSQLENDKGYLTQHQDLSAYALKTELPSVPVQSVNGKTGAVSLSASDVGAMPNGTKIPSKTSDLTNDSGFITGYTETDPTVPAWAKATTKPSYTKSEVGLGNVDNVKQYSASNPPPYPVTSVNGKTGAVTLDASAVGARPSTWMPSASDVGALPASTTIPTKVSQLANDKGYLTAHQDISGKLDASALPTAINTALAQAKESGEFDGATGQRGTGLLSVTTAPSSYTTAVGGITPKYRMAISTIKTQAGVTEVLLGDTVRYSYYQYPIVYMDASYAYFETRVSIRGATGDAGKTAYQYAQDGGYAGTETEFSAKLSETAVSVAPQELTPEEQAQARQNIGIVGLEPTDDDIPKVFLTGSEFSNMTTDKNEVNMEMDYTSKTDNFHAYILIKWQGNTSLNFAKKNFTVKMYADDARTTKLKKKFRDWKYEKNKFVLKANWIDHTHARNIVSANLWNEVVSSRSDYSSLPEELRTSPKNGAIDGFPVKLYVNGTYQGVYTWNIGKDDWQWGMDEDNTNHALLCVTHNTNGVFKDRAYNFRALWSGVDNEAFEIEVGTNSDALKNGVNAMLSCIINNNGATFKNNIGKYLNVQSAIDYYIHQYIICGLDGLGKNILLGSYDLIKWYLGAYDMDAVFGLWYDGTKFVPANYKCPEDYQEKFNLLFERLEENYWTEIQTRYAELRKTVYSVSNMFTHFERFTDKIGTELFAEDLEVYYGIPQGSTNNIKQLRNYIRDRLMYCDSQIMNGIPGTAVSLNSTSLSINTAVANTATLVATKTPSNTTDDVYWWSDNEAVAIVVNGVVTAVANGSCTIYAKCGSGYASCAVSVTSVVVPSYTNQVPISKEADGVTIFNNGKGWIEKTRLTSSGVTKANDFTSTTGYIKASSGAVIRIKGVTWDNGSDYVCTYKSDCSFLTALNGQGTYGGGTITSRENGVVTVTLPTNANIAWIRVSALHSANDAGYNTVASPVEGPGSYLIVTVNEEIT